MLNAACRRRRDYNVINNKKREVSRRWRKIQKCIYGGIDEKIYICTLLLQSDRYEVNHERARFLTPSRCRQDSII